MNEETIRVLSSTPPPVARVPWKFTNSRDAHAETIRLEHALGLPPSPFGSVLNIKAANARIVELAAMLAAKTPVLTAPPASAPLAVLASKPTAAAPAPPEPQLRPANATERCIAAVKAKTSAEKLSRRPAELAELNALLPKTSGVTRSMIIKKIERLEKL